MTYPIAIFLGLIQGLAEFLPVSSSGHLVIIQYFLKLREATANVTFDIFLHLATVLAVVWVYRRDLKEILTGSKVGEGSLGVSRWRLLGLLALSLIATGVILPFKDSLTTQFDNIAGVRVFLLINAVALAVLPALRRGAKDLTGLTWLGAVVIGLVQAIAALPGISRSGSTILAGLLLGLAPREACRYSFLLSIPTILVAGFVQIPDALEAGFQFDVGPASVAFVVAVLGGLVAIPLLIGVVEKGKLWGFAVYCAIVGLALFVFSPSVG